MRIKNLNLFTNNIALEKIFYLETLGFDVVTSNASQFTIKVGWSELTFTSSEIEHKYHYCFLIPSNKLNEALEWMDKRVDIVDIENGRKTQRFEDWNADSFYFFDASGNIAEFIVRYDLNNESESPFNIEDVLSVNEIGLPTTDIVATNDLLKSQLSTDFWKGDDNRFGTNGTQEGLFLLPNYNIKEIWFPTSIKIKPEPFTAKIEHAGKEFSFEFRNERININELKIG